jgi:hypothetical protein
VRNHPPRSLSRQSERYARRAVAEASAALVVAELAEGGHGLVLKLGDYDVVI